MANFLGSLAELLECAVCKEELTDPRILSCHHSFCLRCIEAIIKNSSRATRIQCPTCRQKTRLPEGNPDITKLPVDFRAVQIIQLVAGPSDGERMALCDACSDINDKKIGTPAAAFCNQCSLLYCNNCLKKHEESELTSNHTVTKLLNSDTVSAVATCTLHGNAANWYCLSCKEAVCFTCTLAAEHSEHEIKPPEIAHENLKSKTYGEMTSIKRKCVDESPEEEIKRLKFEQVTVKNQCREEINSIENHCHVLVAEIKNKQETLVGKIQGFKADFDQKNSHYITELEKFCQHLSSSAENVVVTNVKASIEQGKVFEKLESLNKELEQKGLSAMAVPRFTPENSLNTGTVYFALESNNDAMIVKNETVMESTTETEETNTTCTPSTETEEGNAQPTEAESEERVVLIPNIAKPDTVKAVIRRTFTSIQTPIYRAVSPKLLVQSIKWNTLINCYGTCDEKSLGIFLECEPSMLENRACKVDGTIVLVNQVDPLKNLIKTISRNFTEESNNWGYKQFISMDELLDTRSGFVKNGEIVVEVRIEVFKPVTL